jgi:hypothetical protein
MHITIARNFVEKREKAGLRKFSGQASGWGICGDPGSNFCAVADCPFSEFPFSIPVYF